MKPQTKSNIQWPMASSGGLDKADQTKWPKWSKRDWAKAITWMDLIGCNQKGTWARDLGLKGIPA
jgi:hypothetical protein